MCLMLYRKGPQKFTNRLLKEQTNKQSNRRTDRQTKNCEDNLN